MITHSDIIIAVKTYPRSKPASPYLNLHTWSMAFLFQHAIGFFQETSRKLPLFPSPGSNTRLPQIEVPARGNGIQERKKMHQVSARAPVHRADEKHCSGELPIFLVINLSSPMTGRFLGMHPTRFLILINKCQGNFITPHN